MDIITRIRSMAQRGQCKPEHKPHILSTLDLWEQREEKLKDCFAYRTQVYGNADILMGDFSGTGLLPDQFGAALSALEWQHYDLAENLFRELPASDRLPGYLEICQFHRRFPVTKVCFAALAPQMWRAFLQIEGDIARCLQTGEFLKTFELVRSVFHAQTSPFLAGFSTSDSGIEMRFSIGESPGDIFPMLYLEEHVLPALTQKGWQFRAGFETEPEEPIRYNGKAYPLSYFRYTLGKPGDCNRRPIHVYRKDLAALARRDPVEAKRLAKRAVSYAIGEVPAQRYLDPVLVAPKPLAYSSQSLDCLAFDLIVHEGADLDTSARRYLETYAVQAEHLKPSAGLRSDILYSSTCFPEILQAYQERSSYLFNHLLTQGVATGFLFYPKELCTTPPKRHISNMTRRIRDAAGDDIAITGIAIGSEYCYIDFVAFDFLKVLAALKQVFAGIQGGEAAQFASFYPGAAPTSLDADKEIAAYRAAMVQMQRRG